MKKLKLAILASACALFALACSTPTNTGTPSNSAVANRAASTPAPAGATDELADARATYSNTCVRCHKENGEGGRTDIDGEELKVPSFKSEHAKKESDEGMVRHIKKGGDGMPAFEKRLSAEQIDGLVRFIRREFQAGGAPAAGSANAPASGAHD